MIEATPTVEAPQGVQRAPKTREEALEQANRITNKLVARAVREGHHSFTFPDSGNGYAHRKAGSTPGTEEIVRIEPGGSVDPSVAKISQMVAPTESVFGKTGTNTYIEEDGDWAEVHEVGPNGTTMASSEKTEEVLRGIPAQLSELRGSLASRELDAAKHPEEPRYPKGLRPEEQARAEELYQKRLHLQQAPVNNILTKIRRATRRHFANVNAEIHYDDYKDEYPVQAKREARADGVRIITESGDVYEKSGGLSPEDQALAVDLRDKLRQAEATPAQGRLAKKRRAARISSANSAVNKHYDDYKDEYPVQAKREARADGVKLNR